MISIANLILTVSDGSTIASTEIYGEDKKTYINIGSGNVFKLEWTTPTLTNNDTVDRYSLIVKRHDIALNLYYDIFDKNIGLVNEFYVDSVLLPTLPLQYKLSIYVVAYGKQGSIVTSNIVTPYISKGSGTYVKVEGDENTTYRQLIMKRALAFVKIALSDATGEILEDATGRLMYTADVPIANTEFILADRTNNLLVDADGKLLFAPATEVLVSANGWDLAKEGYTKNSEGAWRVNDIKFEVLLDEYGNIIRDQYNEPIYVL